MSAVRGATLFGQGLLQNAYINVQSANQRSQFPGRLDDLPPIAGFQVGGPWCSSLLTGGVALSSRGLQGSLLASPAAAALQQQRLSLDSAVLGPEGCIAWLRPLQ